MKTHKRAKNVIERERRKKGERERRERKIERE
jgi:hypothetical protein